MRKTLKIGLIVLAAPVALALFLVFCGVFAFLSLPLAVLPWAIFSVPFSSPSPEASIGDYRCAVLCEYAVFRDGTSYAEYVYDQPSFENNRYFCPVTPEDADRVLAFVDDFESWVAATTDGTREDARALHQSYRYDPAMLSTDDYFCLQVTDPESPFGNYDLYIFDVEENTLFYMESN